MPTRHRWIEHLSSDLSTRSEALARQSSPDPSSCSTTRYHLLSTAATSTRSSAWGWLRTTFHNCVPAAPQTGPLPSERPLIKPADTFLDWWMDLQPVPASAPGVHSSETWGQQNGAPVPEAAVGLAAAMLITPQEEARILQLNQLINARHAAAKPQNTAQAERSAAKLWKVCAAWPVIPFFMAPLMLSRHMSLTPTRSCRDTVSKWCPLMATSCLRPRFLSSRCGLWTRQCSRMVLVTRSAAWGERPFPCCV